MTRMQVIDFLLAGIFAGALAVAIWSVIRMEQLRRPTPSAQSVPTVRKTIYHEPEPTPAKPLEE